MLENVARVLVFLMVLLQGFYAIYSFADPTGFAALRGTDLAVFEDSDWVRIYGSRTLFVSLIIGYLLYIRNYKILIYGALFGTVMPITDAYLAFEAEAQSKVVIKHVVTVVYLLITAMVLKTLVNQKNVA
ncbi:DUF4267 domain-containing protein [Hahella ganghwensis]|uniref:DUF4267 domain-containing protein n=1 Tax=Hahella ganghwensis TaxID=286420 RepID=UPI00037ABCDF|nr:DUF4267 domain-containing protein [Hahella ganghwensis]